MKKKSIFYWILIYSKNRILIRILMGCYQLTSKTKNPVSEIPKPD